MCVCVCVECGMLFHMCRSMCVCGCVNKWRPEVSSSTTPLLMYPGKVSPLSPDLDDDVSLASQLALETPLSLPPQCWAYKPTITPAQY